VPLPIDNVDTDQIIPARFLKVTDKNGLGKVLFCDWRYEDVCSNVDAADNAKPTAEFVLNKADFQGAQILLAGDNFGCGSSREHAPWALVAWGFRAVVSTSIADIFRNNSLKNGLVRIVVDAATHAKLLAAPNTQVTVSVADQTFTLPDGTRASLPI